jgi:hypothetical protein
MRERPRMGEAFENKKEKSEIIEVSFYPEGGNLINGVTSKVAFKAVNKKREDLMVNWSIRDSKGDEVTTFNTIHDGTGAFYLCPQEETYTAKVRYKDRAYTFDLPKSLLSGYVMTLDNLPENHLRSRRPFSRSPSTMPLSSVRFSGGAMLLQTYKNSIKSRSYAKIRLSSENKLLETYTL